MFHPLRRSLSRTFLLVLVTAIVTSVSMVGAALPVSAEPVTSVVGLEGGGYGHGVGMSQYGAKGQADAGRSATTILTHYYQGTSVGSTAMRPNIRVGLLQGVAQMTVSSAGGLFGSDGTLLFSSAAGQHLVRPGETWQVRTAGAGWQLYRNGQAATGVFGGGIQLAFGSRNSILAVAETGHRYNYGTLDLVHRADPTFDAVVAIGSYEAYLYGLGEVPSSWPMAALEAQAVAGRTYALEKGRRLGDNRPGCSCTVFASVVDQAYVGYDKQAGPMGNRWVQAVDNTAGRAVLSNGVPIQAFYSSSSGGHTENNEFVWGGSPVSYLRGVPDPWDATAGNPNHRWSVSYTREQLSGALTAARLGVGTVTDVATPAPFGMSGRVGRVISSTQGGVTVTGTGGTRRLSGSQLRSALALKSTLFRFQTGAAPQPPPPPPPPHPNGAMFKSASSPVVWVMQEGRRWPAASGEAFLSRASFSEVATVSDATVASYPLAGAGFRDGVLLGTPDKKVWLVSEGRRRHVANEAVFTGLGLQWSAVRPVSSMVAGANPEGVPLTSAGSVPNGLLVKTAADPRVYLVKAGRARHLPNQAVFASYRADLDEIATVSATQLASLGGPGPAIGFRDGKLISTPDDKVWAVADGTRRWITSGQAFAALGYQLSQVVAVPADVAALHPEGPPVSGPPHPDGAVVRSTSGSQAWLVSEGIRYPLEPAEALASRVDTTEVATASDSVLAPVPTAALGFRDGSLLHTAFDNKVYLISNGRRRHVASEAVFDGLGLKASNLRRVSGPHAAVHPEGAPITSSAALVDGMFVQVPGNPAIYLVKAGRARPVVSWAAFSSYRTPLAEVVATTASKVGTPGSSIGFRDGSLISTPDAKVWAVADGTRRWITSAEAFAALGYDFADVVAVPAHVAAVHPEGAVISP